MLYKTNEVLDVLNFKQCKKALLQYAKINRIKTKPQRTGGREYIFTMEDIRTFIKHKQETAKRIIYK